MTFPLHPQGIFLVHSRLQPKPTVSSGCPGSIINISSIIGKVRLSWEGGERMVAQRGEPFLVTLTHPRLRRTHEWGTWDRQTMLHPGHR